MLELRLLDTDPQTGGLICGDGGSLQPEVTADLASACLGTGLGGECGGEDWQIDQRPLTEPHMQTSVLPTGLIYLTLLNTCPL